MRTVSLKQKSKGPYGTSYGILDNRYSEKATPSSFFVTLPTSNCQLCSLGNTGELLDDGLLIEALEVAPQAAILMDINRADERELLKVLKKANVKILGKSRYKSTNESLMTIVIVRKP